jgi:hypothetical protein
MERGVEDMGWGGGGGEEKMEIFKEQASFIRPLSDF